LSEPDVSATPELMAEFLEGLTYAVSGSAVKQVAYRHISTLAYRAADLFNMCFVVKPKAKVLSVDVSTGPPANLPKLVTEFLSDLKDTIVGKPIEYDEADMIVEHIAYHASLIRKEGELAAIFDMLPAAKLETAFNKLDKICQLAATGKLAFAKDRWDALVSSFAILNNAPTVLVKSLEEARQVRNASNVSQFAQKGVGSVYGAGLPPFVDTARKAMAAVDYALSGGATFDATQLLKIYGTGYAHMRLAFDPLACQKHWYDIKKATDSSAVYIDGSIFDATSAPYIFDDTWLGPWLDVIMAKRLGFDDRAKTPSDVGKIRYLAGMMTGDNPPMIIFSKVPIHVFMSHGKAIEEFLYPGGVAIARSIRLMKFGKLHNQECFLCLSNLPNHSITAKVTMLRSDVAAIAGSMAFANHIIGLAWSVGLRLGTKGPRAEQFWTRFVSLLNPNWFWYKTPLSQDRALTNTAVSISAYGADLFVDEVFILEPKPRTSSKDPPLPSITGPPPAPKKDKGEDVEGTERLSADIK